MTTPVTMHPDADRRADLLMSRYATLTEANPGFHYDWHMRAREYEATDADSVTAALTGSGSRVDDLRRLVSDDQVFHLWRLRLEYPRWWIGTRASAMPALLAQVISELTAEPAYGAHVGLTGYPGAHWFGKTREAVALLSEPSRQIIAAALRQELLGRQLCSSVLPHLFDEFNSAAAEFPDSDSANCVDVASLTDAIAAVEAVHGAAWAEAFKTMVEGLDSITWAGLMESLATELRAVR